jgi:hypothetical protein
MPNWNGITGGHATDEGKQLWHVFARNPDRYVGSAFADRNGVFRCMEKMDPAAHLLALGDTDIRNGCFTEKGRNWTKQYKDLMDGILPIPAVLVRSVTAQQSFQKWAKTRV